MPSFYNPVKIFFGDFESFLNQIIYSNIVLITSESISKNYFASILITRLESFVKKNKISSFRVIYKKSGEPSSKIVDDIAKDLKHNNVDAFIGLGGGSIIDTTKFVSLVYSSGRSCASYEFSEQSIENSLPTYLIPTTFGSGSEVTQYSVITNYDTHRKFTISSDTLYADASFLDSRFIENVEMSKVIPSCLDAFIHNAEVLLNRQKNKLIVQNALEGLKLSYENLPKYISGNRSKKILDKLCLSSYFGGLSISQSRTGLIHTISVAFSEFIDLPHGLLNAFILPHVLHANLEFYNGALGSLVSKIIDKDNCSDKESAIILINWIKGNTIHHKLEKNSFNFIEKNKNHIIDRILQDKGLNSVNPVKVDKTFLINILDRIIINGI